MRRESILPNHTLRCAALVATLALTACDGSSDNVTALPPTPPITIGGNVFGLTGGPVQLSLNNAENLSVPVGGGFTFATPQAAGAPWSVAITRAPLVQTCSLNNGSGTADGTRVTNVNVNCNLRSWRAPETFGAPTGQFQQHPQVAIDAQGTAIIVVKELTGALSYAGRLQVAERSASGTWTPVGTNYLDNSLGNSFNFVFGYDLAVAGNGNAFAVWEEVQSDESRRMFASRRTGVGAWTAPTRIDSGSAAPVISAAQVAASADGSAIAVWVAYYVEGEGFAVHASRYQPATGWSTPVRLEDDSRPALAPQIAIDANGNAVATWVKGGSDDARLMGASFRVGSGWSAAVPLDPGSSVRNSDQQVAMNANGDAVVAWTRFDSDALRGLIMATRYSLASGFNSAPVQLTSDGNGWVSAVDVAINASGAAFVAFDHYVPSTRARTIQAVRFTPSGGWDTPFPLGADGLNPRVVIDADGNGTFVYETDSLVSLRYIANGPNAGWLPADLNVDGFDTGRSGDPRIALHPSGGAIAVFSQVTAAAPFLRTPYAVRLD